MIQVTKHRNPNMSYPNTQVKVLHTSDWHLGRRLYGHTRYDEFSNFLDWLYNCIIEHQVDILIVAGDIFDTMTPSNKAQALYYKFLGRISHSSCQHVVIVAGNHDSPSLLDAPKEILKFLNVHIIGTACENIEEEVITLADKNNVPQAIILAVPYLRDKDVRSSQSADTSLDKQAQLVSGITEHYQQVAEIAKKRQIEILNQFATASFTSVTEKKSNTKGKQKKPNHIPKQDLLPLFTEETLPTNTIESTDQKNNQQSNKIKNVADHRLIPIIATGHLMAVGGKTTSDDGVRDLYIGSLGSISANIFDPVIDYVALGHLHVPQLVGGNEHIRYSGSPIAMGFGEANQEKQVLLVEFSNCDDSTDSTLDITDKKKSADNRHNLKGLKTQITSITVPTFHKLSQAKGDLTQITEQINKLIELNKDIWLEVIYSSEEIINNLSEQLAVLVKDSRVEIIKIKNLNTYQRVMNQTSDSESLHDLSRDEVFQRCLDTHDVPTDQQTNLMARFQQIIYEIENEDVSAE